MANKLSNSAVPIWAVPAAVIVAVLIVGLVAWKSLGKNPSAGDGPPMQVKPGQYSIQKEAAAGHLGNGLKSGSLPGPAGQ